MKKLALILLPLAIIMSSCGTNNSHPVYSSDKDISQSTIATAQSLSDSQNYYLYPQELQNIFYYFGSEQNFIDFLQNNKDNPNKIKYELSKTNMTASITNGNINTLNIESCEPYFPPEDRNQIHVKFIDSFLTVTYIDTSGRPAWTHKLMPLGFIGSTDNRSNDCQLRVGRIFQPFPNGIYVGGHLIADFLGGSGLRANMVPQNGKLNNGPWKSMELKIKNCADKHNTTINMQVLVLYPDKLSIIPNKFIVTNQFTPVQFIILGNKRLPIINSIDFDNVPDGGPTMQTKLENFKSDVNKVCQ